MSEQLVTVVGSPVLGRLTPAEKDIFSEVLAQAAGKATDQIRASELRLPPEFEKLGKTVTRPNRADFVKVAAPQLLGPEALAFWTKAHYDQLQALT